MSGDHPNVRPDVRRWPGLTILDRLDGGARTEVWSAQLDGELVVVRRSRRSDASLTWEVRLLQFLLIRGVAVPAPIPTNDGYLHRDGVMVQRRLEGRTPSTPDEWSLVADELRRLHSATLGYAQRPGCCTAAELRAHRRSVDADLDAVPTDVAELCLSVLDGAAGAPVTVIHGDPGAENIRIGIDGAVGLLDWDESRVDVCDLDLAELGATALPPDRQRRAAHWARAWEVLNGWTTEPDYARRTFQALQRLLANDNT